MEGKKDTKGKLRWRLLPGGGVMQSVLRVLEFGARMHNEDIADPNWKRCKPVDFQDALMRHVTAYVIDGKWLDDGPKGTGEPHLACAVANAMFLLWFGLNKKDKTK